MQHPRLADLIAQELRQRIVTGQLDDGAELPSHHDLGVEFQVSLPSIREALRILEHEGLITVRRGRAGGAIVHRPTGRQAAFVLGLVLESEGVTVTDLQGALAEQYAMCAAMCARQADRRMAVALLRSLQEKAVAAINEDASIFEGYCREFHEVIAQSCGSRTLALVVDSLQTLCRTQEGTWAHSVAEEVEPLNIDVRTAGLDAHAAILVEIERGDGEAAAQHFRDHVVALDQLNSRRQSRPIRSTYVRWHSSDAVQD